MNTICEDFFQDFRYVHLILKKKIKCYCYYFKNIIDKIILNENDNIIYTFYRKQLVLNELKEYFYKKEWDIV